jgi:hypothetical protein
MLNFFGLNDTNHFEVSEELPVLSGLCDVAIAFFMVTAAAIKQVKDRLDVRISIGT